MPLKKGSSRATISRNIREMEESGHPHRVAVAAALHTAHPNKRKKKRRHNSVGDSYTGRYY